MILLERDMSIDRPPAEVFAFAADVTQWPRWRSEITQVRQISSGPVGTGTQYELTGEIAGHSATMTGVITEYVPEQRLGFKTTSGPVRAELDLRMSAQGGGTRLQLTARVTPEGVLRLAEPLIAKQAEKMWLEDLAHLRTFLEQER
jgi:uncharacterized protein YndB with AHSA1/START domain